VTKKKVASRKRATKKKIKEKEAPQPGQRIGYARVSTAGQNLDGQLDALKAADCTKIFKDKITGTAKTRPGWNSLVAYCRPGDTLVITELSRMSRSLLDWKRSLEAFIGSVHWKRSLEAFIGSVLSEADRARVDVGRYVAAVRVR